jgi:hypothetical protein
MKPTIYTYCRLLIPFCQVPWDGKRRYFSRVTSVSLSGNHGDKPVLLDLKQKLIVWNITVPSLSPSK